MNILLTGALSWNPERMIALAARGHRLFGLWSRSMAWEQGPYKFAEGIIRDLNIESALDLLRSGAIDIVYSLFQDYDRRLWARDAAPGLDNQWTQMRRLIDERNSGAFRVPIVRHWGFDIHNLDLTAVRALDGQIFCNPQKLRYWTARREDGGCGLDLGLAHQEVSFMDSDLPLREFMNNCFSAKLSADTGEIHTVCVGRPLGINFVQAARHNIHVHVYGNNYDDVAALIARGLSVGGVSRLPYLMDKYLHIHPPIQAADSTLGAIRQAKSRWVNEFSRYDAAWSYVGRPLPWPRLEDQAAIPNRLGTYVLAGLPVIAETLPGFDRYDSLASRGIAIDFSPRDYARLAENLKRGDTLAQMNEKARAYRGQLSFDATIDPLVAYFERVCNRFGAQVSPSQRAVQPGPATQSNGKPEMERTIQFYTSPLSLGSLFASKARAGTIRSRAALHWELATSRARWLFSKILAKYYVSPLMRRHHARCDQN